MRFLRRTPVRTFIIYPVITLLWELIIQRGSIEADFRFLPLMIWGYLQYRLCGLYRIKHGGGGPGLETPPDRLVESGPYAWTRNPMYLGHLIFMLGLAITFWSSFALILLVARAVWFHGRVLRDEKRLEARFGGDYAAYRQRVKRWIPGLL